MCPVDPVPTAACLFLGLLLQSETKESSADVTLDVNEGPFSFPTEEADPETLSPQFTFVNPTCNPHASSETSQACEGTRLVGALSRPLSIRPCINKKTCGAVWQATTAATCTRTHAAMSA